MRLEFAFLCDAANDHGGKLNALGIGIEQIAARSLPAHHPRAVAALRFSFTREELGAHAFEVRVTDGDGTQVMQPVEGSVTLAMPDEGVSGRANMLIDLVQLQFKSFGPHEVTVRMDGQRFVTLPFEVVQAQ